MKRLRSKKRLEPKETNVQVLYIKSPKLKRQPVKQSGVQISVVCESVLYKNQRRIKIKISQYRKSLTLFFQQGKAFSTWS